MYPHKNIEYLPVLPIKVVFQQKLDRHCNYHQCKDTWIYFWQCLKFMLTNLVGWNIRIKLDLLGLIIHFWGMSVFKLSVSPSWKKLVSWNSQWGFFCMNHTIWVIQYYTSSMKSVRMIRPWTISTAWVMIVAIKFTVRKKFETHMIKNRI